MSLWFLNKQPNSIAQLMEIKRAFGTQGVSAPPGDRQWNWENRRFVCRLSGDQYRGDGAWCEDKCMVSVRFLAIGAWFQQNTVNGSHISHHIAQWGTNNLTVRAYSRSRCTSVNHSRTFQYYARIIFFYLATQRYPALQCCQQLCHLKHMPSSPHTLPMYSYACVVPHTNTQLAHTHMPVAV